jgi:hypothetical protein
MVKTYIPELSVEAAQYMQHDYTIRYTTALGWTLSVAVRYEDSKLVPLSEAEQQTSLAITEEDAKSLIKTWQFAAADDAANAEPVCPECGCRH